MEKASQSHKTRIVILTLNSLAAVAIVYLAVVASIMLLQYRQIHQISLLEFAEIDQLRQEYKKDRKNDLLKNRIRRLDVLSRRAWFDTKEQIKTGGYMLAAGMVVLVVCLGGVKIIRGRRVLLAQDYLPKEGNKMHETIALSGLAALSMLTVLSVFFFLSPQRSILSDGANPKTSQPLSRSTLKDIAPKEFEANWPNFRGPHANGEALRHTFTGSFDGPSAKGVRWKIQPPLPGFGSAVIWRNRLFVSRGDKTARALFGYDAFSGKHLWTADTSGILPSSAALPKVSHDTGYAASSPATDGHFVFAVFATGELLCTDLDGNRVWTKNLGIPENHYGYSSSLLAFPNRLFVQYDGQERQILYLFDSASGRIVWQKNRGSSISWSSPALIQWEQSRFIVIATSRTVEAYDAETGERAWQTPCMEGEVAASPAFSEGVVFVANDNARAVGIALISGDLLWKNEEVILPDVASPIAFKKMGYLFSSSGTVTCLDLDSGVMLWEKDLDNGFYSSPILLDNRIFVFDLDGTLMVIRPDRKRLIIENQSNLGEKVVATPAFGAGMMWISGEKHLYAIQSRSDNNATQ